MGGTTGVYDLIRPSIMNLCRPVGLGVFIDFAPGALPQAELWLPHSGRNRRFRLLKALNLVHYVETSNMHNALLFLTRQCHTNQCAIRIAPEDASIREDWRCPAAAGQKFRPSQLLEAA